MGYRAKETSSNKMSLCPAGFTLNSHWDYAEVLEVVPPDNPVCLIESFDFQGYRLGIFL